GVIIAADTLIALDGAVLGKPASRDEAASMLSRLAGRAHDVLTALVVVNTEDGRTSEAVETTRVWFRPLEAKDIERYLATGEYRDVAGAYAIQGLGATLVERIDGDYTNVVGLPLVRLLALLRVVGVDV
ncbi:MAG: Maf family protein, partial [Candidatus Bipolaricaulota bacterium]